MLFVMKLVNSMRYIELMGIINSTKKIQERENDTVSLLQKSKELTGIFKLFTQWFAHTYNYMYNI